MSQPSTEPGGSWAAVTPKSLRPPQPTTVGDQPICLIPATIAVIPVNPVGNSVLIPACSTLNDVPSDKIPMSLSLCDLAQFTINWAYWAFDGPVLKAVGFCCALNSALAPSPFTTSTCCCMRYGWIWFCAEEKESAKTIGLPWETSW